MVLTFNSIGLTKTRNRCAKIPNAKMAYESQWNKIHPCYLHPQTISMLSVQLNSTYLVQPDDVEYLGIHLDRRLPWRKHTGWRGADWHNSNLNITPAR